MSIDWNAIKSKGISINAEPSMFDPTPVGISAVNSLGWEDSISVNWKGDTLTFTYFRVDPFYYMFYKKLRMDGPARTGWPSNTKYPGADLCAEIYICNGLNTTSPTIKNIGTKINTPLGSEGCQQITEDGSLIYFSRSWYDSKKGKTLRALFYANWNNGSPSDPIQLPASINGQDLTEGMNTADNPFLCADKKTFLFEKGPANDHKIYASIKTGTNSYSTPILLPTINEPGVDITQPWMSPDGKTMLYSKNYSTIYLWKPNDPVLPGINPKPIVQLIGSENSAAIGEPTMDQYGNLYFLYVFKADDGTGCYQFDADVYKLKPTNLKTSQFVSTSVNMTIRQD